MIRFLQRVLGLTGLLAQMAPATSAAPVVPPGSRLVHVHDPSTVVRCGEDFWVFSTGPGLPSFHSRDTVNWEPGPHVFDRAPDWTWQAVPAHREANFWAPDVIRLGDRYLLYYAVSTFGANVSAIGLAVSPTLDPADAHYRWTDKGPVVRSKASDDFNAIDPAVMREADGKLWLSFGSYWSGIKLIQLDPLTGQRLSANPRTYALAMAENIEAPYIFQHGGYYYLFVNWGRCCRGVNSTYSIHLGRSGKITGPYLDRAGQPMLLGGGGLFLGTAGAFIGPGHAGIFSYAGRDWFSCHFYDGTHGGRSTLAVLPLTWGADGWPAIEKDHPAAGKNRLTEPALTPSASPVPADRTP